MRATCRLFATLHLFWTNPPSPLTGVNFLLGSSIFLVSIVLQEALLISNLRARSPNICLEFLHTSVAAGVFRDQGTSVIKQPGGRLNNPECRHEVSSERFIQTLRTSKRRFSCRSALDVSLLWLKYQLHQQQQCCIFESWPWQRSQYHIHGRLSHPDQHSSFLPDPKCWIHHSLGASLVRHLQPGPLIQTVSLTTLEFKMQLAATMEGRQKAGWHRPRICCSGLCVLG